MPIYIKRSGVWESLATEGGILLAEDVSIESSVKIDQTLNQSALSFYELMFIMGRGEYEISETIRVIRANILLTTNTDRTTVGTFLEIHRDGDDLDLYPQQDGYIHQILGIV